MLGGAGEWGALVLTLPDGTEARAVLPDRAVFEDLAPRLLDLDGTGAPEIAVVESDRDEGAQLAVYALDRGKLLKIGATPHVGIRHRWLAPAAIADLDGDGQVELAYVETPHVGGALRVWSFAAGGMTQEASLEGFSNHRIGQPFITAAQRDCGDGPEILLPDFGWKRLMAVRLDAGGLSARSLGPWSPEAFEAAASCAD